MEKEGEGGGEGGSWCEWSGSGGYCIGSGGDGSAKSWFVCGGRWGDLLDLVELRAADAGDGVAAVEDLEGGQRRHLPWPAAAHLTRRDARGTEGGLRGYGLIVTRGMSRCLRFRQRGTWRAARSESAPRNSL